MELTEELRTLFAEGAESIKELELTYKNGGKVRGRVHKLKQKPLRLTIQKSEPASGERPRHRAVFDHVLSLELHMQDGRKLRFGEFA